MASCAISPEKFVPLVKQLIQTDPERFLQYDETARFLLGRSDLSNTQKSVTIHNTALLYNTLHGLDATRYNTGKADQVLGLERLLEDPDKHVALLETLYETAVKHRPLTEDQITNSINRLGGLSPLDIADAVRDIIRQVSGLVTSLSGASAEERHAVGDRLINAVEQKVQSMKDSVPAAPFILRNIIGQYRAANQVLSSYIPIRQMNLGRASHLVVLKNGNSIEAWQQENQFYTQNPLSGSEVVIAPEDIQYTRPLRPEDNPGLTGNNGEFLFSASELGSGFAIRNFPGSQGVTALKDLGNRADGSVQIKAVRLSSVFDNRVSRMQSDPLTAGRQHETFENSRQQVKLSQPGQVNEILTVAAPKQQEHVFQLTGVLPSGESFLLYGMNNLTIVDSNNNTTTVDFTDPDHLQKVKQLALKRDENSRSQSELTDDDLATLKNGATYYQQFFNEVTAALEASGNYSEDISDIFYKYYGFEGGPAKTLNLAEYITGNPGTAMMFDAVVDGPNGTVVRKNEQIPVPFILYRTKQTGTWQIANSLPAGHSVMYNGKTYNSTQALHDAVMGTGESHLGRRYNVPAQSQVNAYMLVPDQKGGIRTLAAFPQHQIYLNHTAVAFATGIAALLEQDHINEAAANDAFYAFDKDEFYFPQYKGLVAQVRVRLQNGKAVPVVEIVAPKGSPMAGLYSPDVAKHMTFALPAEAFTRFSRALRESPLVGVLKDRYIDLKGYDLGDREQLIRFYHEAETISKLHPSDKDASTLLTAVQNEHAKIGLALKEFVTDRIEQSLMQLGDQGAPLLAAIREAFKGKELNTFHLVAEYEQDKKSGERTYRPKVIGHNESVGKPENFNVQIPGMASRVSIRTVSPLQVTKSSKPVRNQTAQKTETEDPVLPSTPASAEPAEKKKRGRPRKLKIQDAGEAPFMLSGDTAGTSMETASGVLANILPQFGLNIADLRDVFDLSQVDGDVLGLFRDAVIHLDRSLATGDVAFHEAFHGVFRRILSDPERREVINSAIEQMGRINESALQDFRTRRALHHKNNRDILELMAEEHLAEAFRKFMVKKTSPRTFLQKVYDLIRRILDLFRTQGNVIDSLYGNIASGYYRNAALVKASDPGAVAYQLIPARQHILLKESAADKTVDLITEGDLKIYQNHLTVAQQNDLKYRLAAEILADMGTGHSFEEAFEIQRKKLYTAEYDIHRLIAQSPADEQFIREEYENLYADYRYVLGAAADGAEDIYALNKTGRPEYDDVAPDSAEDAGASSLQILKGEVKRITDRFKVFTDPAQDTAEDPLEQLEGDAPAELEAEYDKSFLEINALESLTREFRRVFSMIKYEHYDWQRGVTITKMVDGGSVFSLLMKVTADCEPHALLARVQQAARDYAYDGDAETGNVLTAVYNRLSELMGLDKDGNLISNAGLHLYRQFVDVFHTTEADVHILNLKTNTDARESYEQDGNTYERKGTKSEGVLVESLMAEDTRRRTEAITSDLARQITGEGGQEYFRENARNLNAAIQQVLGDRILTRSVDENEIVQDLNNLTETLHGQMDLLGFKNIPKSFIRFSLLAIDVKENSVTLPAALQQIYNDGRLYAERGQYLQKDFFRDMANKICEPVAAGRFDVNRISANGDKATLNRMKVILRQASVYLTKKDPRSFPTVVRNAEGKRIYRFVKYTPTTLIAQDIRKNGLESALEFTEVFNDYLRSWYAGNPLTAWSQLPEGERTEAQKKYALFFRNLEVSIFGGTQQTVNDKRKEGKTFKDIDERSMYLSNILAFMDRRTLSETAWENGVHTERSVTTFNRSLTQLEASSTNFFVTSLYQQFAGKGVNTNQAVGRWLGQILNQEFTRIQNEWNSIDDKLARWRQGDNILLNKYNALEPATSLGEPIMFATDENGTRIPHPKLRAYQFNVLRDFAEHADNRELSQTLLDHATGLNGKDNVSFDNLPQDVKQQLYTALVAYGQREFEKFLGNLKDSGVLAADGTSSYIPEKISVDGEQKDLAGYAPEAGQSYGDLNNFLKDFFYNFWINSMTVNQVFDGDMAMGIKNAIDLFKRNKSLIAAGSTLKQGFHKAAYISDLKVFLDPDALELGQWDSMEEMPAEIRDHFRSKGGPRDVVFDGQSISTLMHRMDMYEQLGRLSPDVADILIAAHYRSLREGEIKTLAGQQVVLNSLKTVTASPQRYHKQSEHALLRPDVSALVVRVGQTRAEAHADLERIYRTIYNLRSRIGNTQLAAQAEGSPVHSSQLVAQYETQIAKLAQEAHDYWQPLPGREALHHMLNSMELMNVDQLMDTNASKKVTQVPVVLNHSDYTDLNLSQVWVDNRYKFLQVETSGIKSKIKDSVQPKLIIATEVADMIRGTDLSEHDKDMLGHALQQYNDSLRDITAASKDKLFKLFTDDGTEHGNIRLGYMFDVIRTSLEQQGTDTNTLKFFETRNGQPVHDVNLPAIRDVFKYYLTSLYSNHVHDVKSAGRKDTHVTSFGYKIVYHLESGRVIPMDVVRRNPQLYTPAAGYGTRYPGVTRDENGNYFVEVLIPNPGFKSGEERVFWMQELNKMFSTRVPTEGKRSMIAAKVVDFIDGAYGNSVIVPQLVHSLAGSDLDIDALFSHTYASYRDFSGRLHKYGNYFTYGNEVSEGTARFSEYLSFLMKDDNLRDAIATEKAKILADPWVSISAMVTSVAEAMGLPALSEFSPAEAQEAIDDLRRQIADLEDSDYTEEEQEDLAARGETEIKRRRQIISTYVKLTALMNVLQQTGMPADSASLAAYTARHGNPVIPLSQNQSLDAKLSILSHPQIFEHHYIRKSNGIDTFRDMMKVIGSSPEQIASRHNPFTLDGVISANRLNSGAKSGTAIAATMKKIHAFAEQNDLQLNQELACWFTTDPQTGERIYYDSFKKDSGDLLGSLLSVIVDGAKEPITAVLGMNDENLSTVLGMIAVGVPKEMAIWMNFVPQIRTAVQTVQFRNASISEEAGERRASVGKVLEDEYLNSDWFQGPAMIELQEAGLLDGEGKIIRTKVGFTYTAPETISDPGGHPTPAELGFRYFNTDDPEQVLGNKAQTYLLLEQYVQQQATNFQLTVAGRGVNLFKRLNPDFKSLDNQSEAVDALKADKIFTDSHKLFEGRTVWAELAQSLDHLQRQFSRFLLVRNQLVKPVSRLISMAGDTDAQANLLGGFFALGRFRNYHNNGYANTGIVREENNSVAEMLKPDFWFGHIDKDTDGHPLTTTLLEDIYFLQGHFPDNPFVRHISLRNPTNIREKYVRTTGSGKIEAGMMEQVQDGYNLLRTHVDPKVRLTARKLAFSEMIRTGLGRKSNMMGRYIDSSMYQELSGNLRTLNEVFAEIRKEASVLQGTLNGSDPVARESAAASFRRMVTERFNIYFGGEPKTFGERLDELVLKAVTTPGAEVKTQARGINWGSDRAMFHPKNFGAAAAYVPALTRDIFGLTDGDISRGKYTPFSEISSGETITTQTGLKADAEAAQKKILNRVGVYRSGGAYRFPAVVRNDKGTLFRLVELNGNPISTVLEQRTLQALYRGDERGEDDQTFTGTAARYERVKKQTSEAVSNTAFSKEAAERYAHLHAGTEVPGFVRTVEAPKQPEHDVIAEAPATVSPVTPERVIEGDIWAQDGVPVIPTNMGGVHGAGLAQQAKKRGLIADRQDGAFALRNEGDLVTFPVKMKWSDRADISLLRKSAGKLVALAREYSEDTFLLPLVGLGHGEGDVNEIVPILKSVLERAGNIKLVLPTTDTDRGRQGTVRTDNSLQLVPKVKEMLGLQTAPIVAAQKSTDGKLFNNAIRELRPGSVVKYKEKTWLAWKVNTATSKVSLITTDRTRHGGSPSIASIKQVLGAYPVVSYNNANYIVTENEIYDAATGKWVAEDQNSIHDRQEIQRIAREEEAQKRIQLKDGNYYDPEMINGEMLRNMGYTDSETGFLLDKICGLG